MNQTENNQVPAALVKQCEELNKQWLGHRATIGERAIAVPKLYSGDRTWKIEIQDSDGNPLIQYLHPDKVDGHVLYLAVCGVEAAYARGEWKGRKTAATNIANAITKIGLDPAPPFMKFD